MSVAQWTTHKDRWSVKKPHLWTAGWNIPRPLHYKWAPADAKDLECVLHTAVQSENGESRVCCSSAVKGLQRYREARRAAWMFTVHTPRSLWGCGPGLHTHPGHRCWMWARCLKNVHSRVCTHARFGAPRAWSCYWWALSHIRHIVTRPAAAWELMGEEGNNILLVYAFMPKKHWNKIQSFNTATNCPRNVITTFSEVFRQSLVNFAVMPKRKRAYTQPCRQRENKTIRPHLRMVTNIWNGQSSNQRA